MSDILNFNLFIFDNMLNHKLTESIYVNHDELLKSIGGEKKDLYKVFKAGKTHEDIKELYDDPIFNKSLMKHGLSKTKMEFSNDYDTYLTSSESIKFFNLANSKTSNLDVKYIVIQVKGVDGNWGAIDLYTVGKDMRRFYDGLSTRTIEIKDQNGNNYIYVTSNSGENWILKNSGDKTETFKDNLDIESMRELLKTKGYTLKFVE